MAIVRVSDMWQSNSSIRHVDNTTRHELGAYVDFVDSDRNGIDAWNLKKTICRNRMTM